MATVESMKELIGHTPMVKLQKIGADLRSNLYAKLELYNPAGSIKDRVGEFMIQKAKEEGSLQPGGTIMEATAGNTGIAIAFAAVSEGYQGIFVVPTKFSEEKQQLMKALGATIINTPRELGMQGAIQKAEGIVAPVFSAVL